MLNQLVSGSGPPYTLVYIATSSAFDLSAANVTAASFHVLRGDNVTTNTWAATLSAQTTGSCTLTHTFSPSESPSVENVRIQPWLTTLAGGTIYCQVVVLPIVGQFTLPPLHESPAPAL